MGPRVRQAFHEALDLVLDAIAEEQRAAVGATPVQRRVRKKVERVYPMPANVTPEELAECTALARKLVG